VEGSTQLAHKKDDHMIKQHVVKATLTALTVGLALGLAGCGGTDPGGAGGSASPQMPHMSQMPSVGTSPGGGSPDASTAAQFNDADVMFVQAMLPHHTQAVSLSDTLLAKSGISAETTTLAKQIKAAQQPEITTMQGWLKAWGQSADAGMDGMGGTGMGDGMATDAQLKQLDQASGTTAEKTYLTLMTRHHQGAIMMANGEITSGNNLDAVQLAHTIATSQQAEIETMKKILATL
jgi:uncharacterized protein (DUF305 family)